MSYFSEGEDWYQSLSDESMEKVNQWLSDNPAPEEWRGSRFDYAYAEMTGGCFLE